jgi:hypothetical protein
MKAKINLLKKWWHYQGKYALIFNFLYLILLISFLGIIASFFLLFKGWHDVDLFVNRAVMFNDLFMETGISINVRDINETAVNIKTGEKIIIPHVDVYINGSRQIFAGFILLFFSCQAYILTLHTILSLKKHQQPKPKTEHYLT